MDVERTISKCAFMCRAAIKYDLYVTRKLNDIGNQMDCSTDPSHLIQMMYSYFCSVITLYKLVYGKEISSQEVRDMIITEFGAGSVVSFHNAFRFSYSFERASMLLGLSSKEKFDKEITFLSMIDIKLKNNIICGSWTEIRSKGKDAVDANNEQIKEFINTRIQLHENQFQKMFQNVLPEKFKITFNSVTTSNIFDVLANSNLSCKGTFQSKKRKSIDLIFNAQQAFQDTVRLKYSDEVSFNRFYKSIREGSKEICCSAFPLTGGVHNGEEQLYYFKPSRTIKDDSSVDEETQPQEDTIGDSSFSLEKTQQQLTETSSSLISTEHDRSTEVIQEVQVLTLQKIKQEITTYISNAIINKRNLRKTAIKNLIKFTEQQDNVALVDVYLDIYKAVYEGGKREFERQDIGTHREVRYKAGTDESYYGKSGLDKAMDSFSKEIKKHLWQIGMDHILEFFAIFLAEQEHLIRPLLSSKKFLDMDATKKWEEVQKTENQYNLDPYVKLASRLSDEHQTFMLRQPQSDTAAKQTLIKLFERCIPINWARDIQTIPTESDDLTPKVDAEGYWQRGPDLGKEGSTTEIDLEESTGGLDLESEESTEGEKHAQRNTSCRTIVTRTSTIPVNKDIHGSWSGNKSSSVKRKLESSPSKSYMTPEKILVDEETPRKIQKQKNIELQLKYIADEVNKLFNIGRNTKLSRNQDVVDLLFTTLKSERFEEKETYLNGKRIWDFFLPANEDPDPDHAMSFVRAHYNIYQKLVIGSESSVPITDLDLVMELDRDLYGNVSGNLDHNHYKVYSEKVINLHNSVVCNESREGIHFSEEDLFIPFLHNHFDKLEHLNLFVLDATTNTYKLKAIILNGGLFYGPFRFTDISLKLNLSIFFSPLKTQNTTQVDMSIFAEEFGLSVNDVKMGLDRIQSFIRTNEIMNEDIEYLAQKFWRYAEDKETVLDKSDIPPGSTMTDTTKETSVSLTSKVPSIQDLQKKLDALLRKKSYSEETQAEVKELLNELFSNLP